MKIAIDARMYGLEHAGIGRYIVNLIGQIDKTDDQNDYYLLLRKKYFESLKLLNKNFRKVLADYPHYSLKEQIFLPIQLIKLRPDLVHFPHFNVPVFWFGKSVVTIHDLIKHQSKGPQTTTRWLPLFWIKHFVYKTLMPLVVKRSSKILVPTKYWKNELVRKYKIQKEKVAVTYEGVEKKFSKIPAGINCEYIGLRPYLLYAGNLYPHKNVEKLVEALIRYHASKDSKEKLSLVVVCSRNVFYNRFRKKVELLEAEKFVKLIGFVTDEELVSLYHEAEAFVYPSLVEGFGLQGLEAMAVGCPVLASEIPVFREVYGNAAIYFNPKDPDDISKKIKLVVESKPLKNRLRRSGFKQAEKYSWEKMARQTLSAYKEVISS